MSNDNETNHTILCPRSFIRTFNQLCCLKLRCSDKSYFLVKLKLQPSQPTLSLLFPTASDLKVPRRRKKSSKLAFSLGLISFAAFRYSHSLRNIKVNFVFRSFIRTFALH